jgi:hypothetical protein
MKTRRNMLQPCICRRLATSFAAATLLLAAATTRADIAVSNRVVTTFRNVITVDDTGLPAQIEIRALTNDLPLVWRAEKERPATLIKRIGRGPQLAAPLRLEAVIDKVTFVAQADAPAELTKTDKGLEAAGTWQADKLKGRLRIVYAEDGSVTGQVTYDAKGTDLERLDVVMELDGPVDTAIAGNPDGWATEKSLPPEYGTLGSKSGVLWLNGKNPEGDGKLQKGPVTHFFLGNGDRGFTWLAGDGIVLDKDAPSMSVERSRAKVTQWKIALVNKSPRGGEKTANFAFLIHPARAQVADRRLTQWQPWSEKAATPTLDAAARGALAGTNVLVRAEAASVCEVAAARALLEGVAGGEALNAGATLADRFPLGLFRYLAAPHTALAAQLRPNAATLTSAGASPAPDRMALGRALLHDIGVDLGGLADRVGAADVARALEEFGYFESDGQTEFLPYWRTEGIFQFGEDFEADADKGFAVTSESPTARTKVSAFIRSTGVEKTQYKGAVNRRKTLFVLVNEGTQAVREYLIIQNPQYLFGGPNKVQVEQIYSQLDFSYLAADGDWNRGRVERSMPEIYSRAGTARGAKPNVGNRIIYRAHMSELMDLETGGFVRMGEKETKIRGKFAGDAFLKNGWQIYGPVYVPARSMRLLYGAGSMVLPQGIAGRVFDRKTGKPLSVPVHVFEGTFQASETPAADKDRRLLVTVQADKEGRFRCPGISKIGTVVAEVAGKMVPAQPQRTIGNYEPWEGAIGGGAWPSFDLARSVIFDDNKFGDAGKWLDVLIEVDAPPAP